MLQKMKKCISFNCLPSETEHPNIHKNHRAFSTEIYNLQEIYVSSSTAASFAAVEQKQQAEAGNLASNDEKINMAREIHRQQ